MIEISEAQIELQREERKKQAGYWTRDVDLELWRQIQEKQKKRRVYNCNRAEKRKQRRDKRDKSCNSRTKKTIYKTKKVKQTNNGRNPKGYIRKVDQQLIRKHMGSLGVSTTPRTNTPKKKLSNRNVNRINRKRI